MVDKILNQKKGDCAGDISICPGFKSQRPHHDNTGAIDGYLHAKLVLIGVPLE